MPARGRTEGPPQETDHGLAEEDRARQLAEAEDAAQAPRDRRGRGEHHQPVGDEDAQRQRWRAQELDSSRQAGRLAGLGMLGEPRRDPRGSGR